MPNRPGPTPRVAASLPRLRAMARDGYSTAQAARALTRNAVIGRARDYRIAFNGPAASPSSKSLETSSGGR